MPNIAGPLNTVRNFMSVVREVDFDEVRSRAETAPRVLVVSEKPDHAGDFITAVFGDDAQRYIDVRSEWFGDIDGTRYDVIVVLDPMGSGVLTQVQQAVGGDSPRKVVSAAMSLPEITAKEIERARDVVVSVDLELAPALGRRFPEIRLASVRAIIDETSKANAQFALVSNVPAVVPVVGNIVAAGADLIVLTKNQVMMVFKIAAAHNRDLNNQMAIMRELAPVVGGGFLWRTVAREAAAFLPLAAGTVPKVAIAYVGTVVMGRAADYYYRFGEKPTRENLRAFTARAWESVLRLRIGKNDVEEVPGPGPEAEKRESEEPSAK